MQHQAATAEDWARFLRPILASVSNPPSADDFRAKVAAIAFAMPDTPRHMLTEWRQREAMRRFKFWPAPADLAEWLGPDLRDERETALLRLAAAEPEPERAPRSMEEILAARAKAQEAVGYLRSVAADKPENAPVKPRYLSPGQLLAVYEQLAREGNEVARVRVAHIRKQMADANG